MLGAYIQTDLARLLCVQIATRDKLRTQSASKAPSAKLGQKFAVIAIQNLVSVLPTGRHFISWKELNPRPLSEVDGLNNH